MGTLPKDFLWGGALAAHQFEGDGIKAARAECSGRHDGRRAWCAPENNRYN